MYPFSDVTALPACASAQISVKALEHRRQARFDVRHKEVLLVQEVVTLRAVPLKPVAFRRVPPPLDDQAERACWALRGVRHEWWQQEDFTRADRVIHRLVRLHRPQRQSSLDLVEKFGPRVNVIIRSCVRTTDDHDDEITRREDLAVGHGRHQLVPVCLYPGHEIERSFGTYWCHMGHYSDPRVGNLFRPVGSEHTVGLQIQGEQYG